MAVEMIHETRQGVSALTTIATNWARCDMKTTSPALVRDYKDMQRAILGIGSSLERLTRRKLTGILCHCIVVGSDNGCPTSTENTVASSITSSCPNSIKTALGIVTDCCAEYLTRQFPETHTVTIHCSITIGDLVSVPSTP